MGGTAGFNCKITEVKLDRVVLGLWWTPSHPKLRTLTISEQYEMPVFDVMAFAQTFYYLQKRKRLSQERKAISSGFRGLR